MKLGYSESTSSWGDVLRSHRDRGLGAPVVLICDGNFGMGTPRARSGPRPRRQRCLNHRLMKIVDKLPKRLQPEVSSHVVKKRPIFRLQN